MKELGYGEDYKYQPQYAYGPFMSDMMMICVDEKTLRHPVTNEYLPPQIRGEIVLCREGDSTGKKWDEDALRQWEEIENGGQAWAGRQSSP
jgi:putative ATPase